MFSFCQGCRTFSVSDPCYSVFLSVLSSGLQVSDPCYSVLLIISGTGLLPGPNLFCQSFSILPLEVGGGRLLPDSNLLSFCLSCHQRNWTFAETESVVILPVLSLGLQEFY